MHDNAAICPGQKELMPGDNPFYLRATFMVYWENAMPSGEAIYLQNKPPVLTYSGIEQFQDEVLALIKSNITGSAPLSAFFQGYSGIEMSDAEVTKAGWRVLSGQPRPAGFGHL